MVQLLRHPRVKSVVSDQCEYGLTTWTDAGSFAAAKKPTRWATTSDQMVQRLNKRCSKTHSHQPLLAGRAAQAAFYPLHLITEILRGIRDTYDFEHPITDGPSREMRKEMSRVALIHDDQPNLLAALREETLARSNPTRTTLFKHADGTSQKINLHEHFRPRYIDEYTGEALPSAWVQAAIHEEI